MPAGRRSFVVMALRALSLRCPWCANRRTFLRGWFRRHPRCRTCGIAWNREVGFELGAVTVSTILTFGAITICMALGFVATAPEIPVVPLMLVCGAVGVLVPVLAYPFSYTLWLAFDLAVHPPDDDELTAAARAMAEGVVDDAGQRDVRRARTRSR
jgi:uncharacterized protein (DUF983 family)